MNTTQMIHTESVPAVRYGADHEGGTLVEREGRGSLVLTAIRGGERIVVDGECVGTIARESDVDFILATGDRVIGQYGTRDAAIAEAGMYFLS